MKRVRRKKEKKSMGPKIIMSFIVLTGVYLYFNNDIPPEENTDKLRTLQDIEDNFQTLTELKEEAKEQHDKTKTHDFQNAQICLY